MLRPLIILLVSFPLSSYSVEYLTEQTENIVLDPTTGKLALSNNNGEPQSPKKPLQLNVSTDDLHQHSSRLLPTTPDRVGRFARSLSEYSTMNRSNSDSDIGFDKTKSFRRSISKSSQVSNVSDEPNSPTKSVESAGRSGKLPYFSRSITRNSDSDTGMEKIGSLLKSQSRNTSFTSKGDDDDTDIDVPRTPSSFLRMPKALSSEDVTIYFAAINQHFWFNLEKQVNTASVTPYRIIELPSEDIEPIAIDGYTLVRSVTVLRHATRLPTEDVIIEMKKILPELQWMLKKAVQSKKKRRKAGKKSSLSPNKCYTKEMKQWKIYEDLEDDDVEMKLLVEEGKREAINFGKRFRTFFKYLLPEEFDKESIIVKFTKCPRTKDTAFNVIEGVFEKSPPGDDWYEEVEGKKSVLKYDSSCPAWKAFKKSVLNEDLTKNFLNSDYLKGIAKEVAAACGLEEDEFSVDDLILVYETCGYEFAWVGSSPWCNLLTEEQMKVLEYVADLELHVIAGYGNVLNTKIPCKLYNDLMENLLHNEKLKALIYVTHLTSILKYLAFLGLYRDTSIDLIIYRGLYDPDIEDRNWRSAYIGTFLTNISTLLFEDENSNQFIQVRHQERPIHIPSCPLNKELLCPLDIFERSFENFSYKNCNFDEWCKVSKIPPEEKKLEKKKSNKSFTVGERRKMLKKEWDARKKAKIDEGTTEKEMHEKDNRRIKSAGDVGHQKALDEEINDDEPEQQVKEENFHRLDNFLAEFGDDFDT